MRQLAAVLFLLAAQTLQDPIESAHRHGPGQLESWTLKYVVPGLENQGPLPMRLVIARGNKPVRVITGSPSFVWQWIFLRDGKEVAYETGPLHSSLGCVLLDVRSGKRLAEYDCFHELAPDAPDWVKALEADREPY